jgi:hypothetical protein
MKLPPPAGSGANPGIAARRAVSEIRKTHWARISRDEMVAIDELNMTVARKLRRQKNINRDRNAKIFGEKQSATKACSKQKNGFRLAWSQPQ